MTPFLTYSITGILLFGLGLHALIVREHLLRKLLSLNVMSSGVFLLIVAVAERNGSPLPDPVPHAMVLTGIVVAVSVSAVALSLIRRLHARTGRASLHEEEGLE